jgi:hypothetical protein
MRGRLKMKKCKRILSLALAATMALGVFGISASAANTTTPITSLTVTKHVDYNHANITLPEKKFTVTITPATGDYLKSTTKTVDEEGKPVYTLSNGPAVISGQTVQTAPALKTSTHEYEIGADTDTSSEDGVDIPYEFKLNEFESTGYTATGIYRYVIKETLPQKEVKGDDDSVTYVDTTNDGYIEYDDTVYLLDVYVGIDDSGNFVINDIALADTEANKPESVLFTNKVSTAELTIKKKITNSTTELTNDMLYDFYLMIPEEGDTITLKALNSDENGTYFLGYIHDADGNIVKDRNNADTTSGAIKFYVGGKTIDADAEENGTHFQLKAGEKLVVAAPVSMIFKVKEADYSASGYTTSYTYKEVGTYVASKTLANTENVNQTSVASNIVAKGTVNTEGTTVTFTNAREITKPNTGISVDVIPYVLVMLIAVCGAVLFISKKRRIAR